MRARIVPPAGPRYDLFELAVVLFIGGLFVYVLQTVDSAASAILTLPGQRAGGWVLVIAAVIGGACTYRDRTVGAAAWIIGVADLFWALVLAIGCTMDPRWGSAFLAVVFAFHAQWARKTWDRYALERDVQRERGRG